MNIKHIPAATLLIACSLPAQAQKMITFESRTKAIPENHRRRHQDDGKNALTIGLASAFSGYTALYYERALSSLFTVEVGAGVTYRNVMFAFTDGFYDEGSRSEYFGNSSLDIADDYSSHRYRKALPGQYFSIAPKLYCRRTALNGGYLSPMIQYKNYRTKAQLVDESAGMTNYESAPRTDATMEEHIRCIDYTLNFGGQYQAGGHVSIGFRVGLGVRAVNGERQDIGGVDDGGNNVHLYNAVYNYNTVRPLIHFNFVIGGWF